MNFWLRFFSITVSFLACLLIFSIFFLLNNIIPHWIKLGKIALENRTQTELKYENVQIDLLRRTITFKKVVFKGSGKEAKVEAARLDFVIPDLQIHSFVIRRIILEQPEFWVLRAGKNLNLFPDFFRNGPTTSTWKWRIQLVVLNEPKVHFHDEIFGESGTLLATSKEIRISQDFDTYTTNLKGQIHFPEYPDSELAFDFKGDLGSAGHNHDLLVQAIHLDLPFLSAYQYPFSKIHLTNGTARIYADIHCRMGILDGYSHLNLSCLEMNGFSEGIFSTALGLSSASFLSMLKENHDELELDFYIKGTQDKPELKLGETTRHFLLTAPIAITKGTINLVETVLNTALLGIPGKIKNIINPSEERKQQKEREKKTTKPDIESANSLEDLKNKTSDQLEENKKVISKE